ncbi:hypothetical protein ASG89_27985 [Paenibacillus sp. Soil766]|uniref:hypothetical protein n=1 Tax=Paenibacillus sp. Soil766 TaxID=1736404 RepID=UPI00070B551F|nr:hypothetical protein [Paenibacillus sp. Soil766]KRE99403.1 hypothetical protein ASG89_27985 [Paenibacillus sp. Soil766]
MKTGNHQYMTEVVAGWGKLPEGASYGYTHGIVIDKQDNVYVLHTGQDNVAIFNRSGEFIRSWSVEGIGDGAHGFYLHAESDGEYLYITDTNHATVLKTTIDGEIVLRLEPPVLPEVYNEEKKYKPTDIAVAPNGDIYVTDGYGQHWIHQYSAKGDYLGSFGGTGSEPGRLKCPHGISVKLTGDSPELYVADRGNFRIQVFTMDGKHKRFIQNDMDMPCSFYFADDYMFFPDLHSRITVFNAADDTLVAHLGEDQQAYKQQGWPNLPKTYYRDNRFSSPHGVCVDSHGDVYVSEWISDGRVTKLRRI